MAETGAWVRMASDQTKRYRDTQVDDQPGAVDRADLEDRLDALRAVLASMARGLAEARREVNTQAAENRRLRRSPGRLSMTMSVHS